MNGTPGFDNPWALALFALLLPLLILDLIRRGAGGGAAHYFSPARPSPEGEGGWGFSREFRLRCLGSGVCFYLFLACGVIALAGPRWGSRTVTTYRRGLDLVFALDLSRSMEVRDVSGFPGGLSGEEPPVSRLERALTLAVNLAGRTGEIRRGLAIGRGRGILALPLSYDTEGLVSFLRGLGGNAMTGTGTNLEALVDAAAGAFQDAFPGRRGIVLFSDGEALSGNLGAALDRARGAGISLCILGLGTDAGGPVPAEGSGEGLLLDEAGDLVMSYRRGEVLREAALRTGGVYLDGNRDDGVVLLAEYLRSLSSGLGPGASHREPGVRWHFFALAGLIFWGLSRILGLQRRHRRRRHGRL
jgi:Ca-activated chloride channel family protein